MTTNSMAIPANEAINDNIPKLVNRIQNGEIKGSYDIAVATVATLKEIISNSEWATARNLMDLVITNGRFLIDTMPLEATIGNMVRRILHIIREEYRLELKNKFEEADTQESLHKIVTADNEENDFNVVVPSLKSHIIEHINECEVEMETCFENITKCASGNIHSNEIIMTLGKSTLVQEFLKVAAETRTFEVIVAESGPLLDGHEMARNLAKAKIKTTLISDVAIFAMMSRVNKVIIGTHAVMANGGLRAVSGSRVLAEAAKHYSVPVTVLLPLYKLSPLYLCSSEQKGFNEHISPFQGVIEGTNAPLLEKIHAHNPGFDYVPPELVTLFISNAGGNAPSYIYRLLSELYHRDDYKLNKN